MLQYILNRIHYQATDTHLKKIFSFPNISGYKNSKTTTKKETRQNSNIKNRIHELPLEVILRLKSRKILDLSKKK